MLTLHVQDMTCNHCVKAITQALQAVDAGAKLAFDLPAHQVRIESATASADELRGAMLSAGYPSTLAAGVPVVGAGKCGSGTGRCCCG